MRDQIIIALSGRKGSGKNTVAKFIAEYFVKHYCPEYSSVPFWTSECFEQLVRDNVIECSFADKLKEFCLETLDLPYESCYGSDEEKNAPTQYLWENAPSFLRWKFGGDPVANDLIASGCSTDYLMDAYYCRLLSLTPDRDRLKTGPMTGREIMQIFGTDLIRHTFGNVWARATVQHIKKFGHSLAIITDNRFENEIKEVLRAKGYIIRLTRSPYGYNDVHPSESALDHYDWNQERHFVVDNKDLNIEKTNEAIRPLLDQIFGVRANEYA